MTTHSDMRTLDRLLADHDMRGQRILLRADLDVPVADDGRIAESARLNAARASLGELRESGAVVLLVGHRGRPRPDDDQRAKRRLSLAEVADALAETPEGKGIRFVADAWDDDSDSLVRALADARHGDAILAENVRFLRGETENHPDAAQRLANLCDRVVLDAFACAHRAHASTFGAAQLRPAWGGRALVAEVRALEAILADPPRPLVAAVGGGKTADKANLLRTLIRRADAVLIGGAMANDFLAARGVAVGRSKLDDAAREIAPLIEQEANHAGCRIRLPSAVRVAPRLADNPTSKPPWRDVNLNRDDVDEDEMILDLAPDGAEAFLADVADAETLVWNGPMGAFETQPFERGSVAFADGVDRLADENGLRVAAGGGDTLAAVALSKRKGRAFAHLSTGGGAFLARLAESPMPSLDVLRRDPATSAAIRLAS